MRSFILNVKENKAGMIEVEDSLSRFYELLDCETIDVPERTVGGVWYDKLRRLIDEDPRADYILWNGNRAQIKRKQFESFVDKLSCV